MSKTREALEAAKAAMIAHGNSGTQHGTRFADAINLIEAALAEPEQEPVTMHKVAEERDKLMQMVQEYASTWAIVGGRFDDGSAFEDAKKSKDSIFRQTAKLATISFELGFEKERGGTPSWQELSADKIWDVYDDLEDDLGCGIPHFDEVVKAVSAALRAKNEVKV